jgi:hypothetical protein
MSTSKPSVSSAIVGSFDPIEGLPPNVKNTWVFEYNKSLNSVSFCVQVGIPPMLIDNANQNLHSTLELADIDQLINWLSVVKMNLN